MSFRDRHLESIVGGFLATSLGAFLLLVAFSLVGGGWLTPTSSYRLVLDHGTGITPGVEVTIAGMKVGSVSEVHLTPDRRVELLLSVDRAYAAYVRADSVGQATMNLTGKVVVITGGSDAAPQLEDGGTLVPGTNFDVFLALERMDLVGNLERMQKVLEDLNTLAAQLHVGDGQLPEAVDDVLALIADLQAGKGTVGRLLKEDETLVDLGEAIASVDRMAASVERASAQLEATSTAVDRAAGAVVETAKPIESASAALGRTAASVGASSDKLASTLDRLEGSLVELERTLRAIQNVPLVRGQMKKVDEEGATE